MISKEEAQLLLNQMGSPGSSMPSQQASTAEPQASGISKEEALQLLQQHYPEDYQALQQPQSQAETPGKLQQALSGFFSGAITEPARGLWNFASEATQPVSAGDGRGYIPSGAGIGTFIPTEVKPFERLPSAEFYQQAGIPAQFSPDQVNQSTTGIVSSLLGSLAAGIATPMGRAFTAPAIARGILPSIGRGATQGAISGAATAPLFMPDTENLQAMATGGALGGAVGGALSGIPAAVRSFRKMGGTATPEEIKSALRDADIAGVSLPLAETVESPMLKGFQSAWLSKTPGSGMAREYHEIGNKLRSGVTDTIEELAGNQNVEGLSGDIFNGLKEGWRSGRKATAEAYGNVAKIAQETGQQINLGPLYQNLSSLAKDHTSMDEIVPGISRLVSTRKLDRFMKDIKKNTLPPSNNIIDFSKARQFDEFLNKANRDAISGDDKRLSNVITSLKKSLNYSIDSSIDSANNPQLSNAWQNAKQTYIEKLVPYEDKDILKFLRGKRGASQIIPTFIKSGTWENPEQMKKLTSLLPEEQKKPLGALFLSRGRDINPDNVPKMLSVFNKIGNQTKRQLFPPEAIEKFNAIMRTGKRLGAQKDQMYIPKTGDQSAIRDSMAGWSTLLMGAAAGGFGVAGHLGAAASVLGAATLPRGITKYLLNPNRVKQALKAHEAEK